MIAQSLKTKLIALILKLLFLVVPTLPLFAQDIAPFVTPKIDPSNFRQLKTTTQQQGKQIQVDKVAELQKALDVVSAELEALKKRNQYQKNSADKLLIQARSQESKFEKLLRDQRRRMESLMEKFRKLSERDRLGHESDLANKQPKDNPGRLKTNEVKKNQHNDPGTPVLLKTTSYPEPSSAPNSATPFLQDEILMNFRCPNCRAQCDVYFHARTGRYCLHKTRFHHNGIRKTTTHNVTLLVSPPDHSMQRITLSLDGRFTLYRGYANQYFLHQKL